MWTKLLVLQTAEKFKKKPICEQLFFKQRNVNKFEYRYKIKITLV